MIFFNKKNKIKQKYLHKKNKKVEKKKEIFQCAETLKNGVLSPPQAKKFWVIFRYRGGNHRGGRTHGAAEGG